LRQARRVGAGAVLQHESETATRAEARNRGGLSTSTLASLIWPLSRPVSVRTRLATDSEEALRSSQGFNRMNAVAL